MIQNVYISNLFSVSTPRTTQKRIDSGSLGAASATTEEVRARAAAARLRLTGGLVVGTPREGERVSHTPSPTSRSKSKSRPRGTKGSITKRPQIKVGKWYTVK